MKAPNEKINLVHIGTTTNLTLPQASQSFRHGKLSHSNRMDAFEASLAKGLDDLGNRVAYHQTLIEEDGSETERVTPVSPNIHIITVPDLTKPLPASRFSPVLSGGCAVHLTITFSSSMSPQREHSAVEAFLAELVSLSRVSQGSMAWFGYRFEKPYSHCHMVVYSQKQRKTGRSIANLPRDAPVRLQQFWQSIGGKRFTMRKIYDADGLFKYWQSDHNMAAEGQITLPAPTRNLSLLRKRLKQITKSPVGSGAGNNNMDATRKSIRSHTH